MMATESKQQRRVVVHYVSGGGSGSTRVALNLALAHKQGGEFEPVLILRAKHHSSPKQWVDLAEAAGIRCYYFRKTWRRSMYSNILRLLRIIRPDIIFCHGFPEHLWGRLAALKAGVPRMFQVEHNLERYTWWKRMLSRYLGKYTEKIICVSRGVAEFAVRNGADPHKIQVIYNGIELQKFWHSGAKPWAQRQDAALMVARFSHQKDQYTLVRAAALLRAQDFPLPVHFIGRGNPFRLGLLRWRIRCRRMNSAVTITGYQADISNYLADHKIFVLSSFHEGFALALLEAMASGCLVIASDAPGIRELIRHGDNGWLFPIGDHRQLAALLRGALEDQELSMRIAAAAREGIADRYTREKMVRAYEALL
ncbi:MAG: glycosyltransferase [Verrucomicrobia bacterium]|nr:glycosyltransferase [Verrucomicrobiota bacterium]